MQGTQVRIVGKVLVTREGSVIELLISGYDVWLWGPCCVRTGTKKVARQREGAVLRVFGKGNRGRMQ